MKPIESIYLIIDASGQWIALDCTNGAVISTGSDYRADDPIAALAADYPDVRIDTGMLVPMDQFERFSRFVESEEVN